MSSLKLLLECIFVLLLGLFIGFFVVILMIDYFTQTFQSYMVKMIIAWKVALCLGSALPKVYLQVSNQIT